MSRENPIDGTAQGHRQVLGNLTNTVLGNVTSTLGKRPIPFDLENPTLEGKETIGCEKNTSPVAKRRTGNYFSLEKSGGFTMENYGTASNNRGLYFSNLMSELGAQGIDLKGREQSPDSELNLEEDYESENDEPLKHNTSCSSNIFSALNSEVLKLGCTGVLEKSCSCSFCVKGERSFLFMLLLLYYLVSNSGVWSKLAIKYLVVVKKNVYRGSLIGTPGLYLYWAVK